MIPHCRKQQHGEEGSATYYLWHLLSLLNYGQKHSERKREMDERGRERDEREVKEARLWFHSVIKNVM